MTLRILKSGASQIQDFMGYNEGENNEPVTELTEEILRESQEISNIKAQYIIFPDIKFNNETKDVEGKQYQSSNKKNYFREDKKI